MSSIPSNIESILSEKTIEGEGPVATGFRVAELNILFGVEERSAESFIEASSLVRANVS